MLPFIDLAPSSAADAAKPSHGLSSNPCSITSPAIKSALLSHPVLAVNAQYPTSSNLPRIPSQLPRRPCRRRPHQITTTQSPPSHDDDLLPISATAVLCPGRLTSSYHVAQAADEPSPPHISLRRRRGAPPLMPKPLLQRRANANLKNKERKKIEKLK